MTETAVGEDGGKVGELKISKFHVICACKGGDYGVFWNDPNHPERTRNKLVEWMVECVKAKGSVTMKELASYLTEKGNSSPFNIEDTDGNKRVYYMHPQVWPVDDYKIFRKIGR